MNQIFGGLALTIIEVKNRQDKVSTSLFGHIIFKIDVFINYKYFGLILSLLNFGILFVTFMGFAIELGHLGDV